MVATDADPNVMLHLSLRIPGVLWGPNSPVGPWESSHSPIRPAGGRPALPCPGWRGRWREQVLLNLMEAEGFRGGEGWRNVADFILSQLLSSVRPAVTTICRKSAISLPSILPGYDIFLV